MFEIKTKPCLETSVYNTTGKIQNSCAVGLATSVTDKFATTYMEVYVGDTYPYASTLKNRI